MAVQQGTRQGAPSYKAGVLTLSVICGLIDATCLLALGGVFAELMTGNLLLVAVSLGAGSLSLGRLLAYAGAILPFLVGAFVAGLATNGRHSAAARLVGYPVEWAFVVAATITAALLTPGVSGGQSEAMFFLHGVSESEPTSEPVRITIVAMLAFAMGIHNALMRKHGVPDVATNVLTLTLTGLVAESPLARGTAPRWKRRLASILLFIVGAVLGAWLLHWHVAAPLLAASALFTAALWPLTRGRVEPAQPRM